jgi:hypothetical protein
MYDSSITFFYLCFDLDFSIFLSVMPPKNAKQYTIPFLYLCTIFLVKKYMF